MTGFEKMFQDLLINPDMVHAIMDKALEFGIEQTCRTLEAADGRGDIVWLSDDVGSQDGPLISTETFDESYKGEGCRYTHSDSA